MNIVQENSCFIIRKGEVVLFDSNNYTDLYISWVENGIEKGSFLKPETVTEMFIQEFNYVNGNWAKNARLNSEETQEGSA